MAFSILSSKYCSSPPRTHDRPGPEILDAKMT